MKPEASEEVREEVMHGTGRHAAGRVDRFGILNDCEGMDGRMCIHSPNLDLSSAKEKVDVKDS